MNSLLSLILLLICLHLTLPQKLDNNWLSEMTEEGEGNKLLRPMLVLGPQDSFVVRQRPATLTCRALHATRIRFKCNNQWVESEQHVTKEGIDETSGLPYVEGSVPIHRKEVEEYFGFDGFKCECYASHRDGQAVKSGSAVVKVAFMRKHFYRTPFAESVSVGRSIQLPCEAPDADPMPQIFWQHNGIEVMRGADSNVIPGNDGSLLISSARIHDSGEYLCGARNPAATKFTKPAVLTVFVDGSWSNWSSWSGSCNIDCHQLRLTLVEYRKDKENGMLSSNHILPKRKRKRKCNSPEPINGGKICPGPSVEEKDCSVGCSVDGGWTSWNSWSECSTECHKFRRRQCTDPTPLNSGTDCHGNSIMTRNCTQGLCKQTSYDKPYVAPPPLNHSNRTHDQMAMFAGLGIAMLLLVGVLALIVWLLCCRKKKSCCRTSKDKDQVYYAGSRTHFTQVLEGPPDLTRTLLAQLNSDNISMLKGGGSVVSTVVSPAHHPMLNGYGSQGYPGTPPLPDISTFSLRSKSSGGASSGGYGSRMVRDNLRNMSTLAGSKLALLEANSQSSQSSHPPSLDSSDKNRCTSRSSGANSQDNSEDHYATLYDYDTPHDYDSGPVRTTISPSPSTVEQACRIFDHRGGKIILRSCGVILTVPQGAIERGQTEQITVQVSTHPEEAMNNDGVTTLLSPIVQCGPCDLVLLKPVVISLPHCALVSNSWHMQLLTCISGMWTSAVALGSENICTSFYCQLDTDYCHIMTDSLCKLALVGCADQSDHSIQVVPVKKTKLAVFAPLYPSALDYSLRLYCVEDTPAAMHSVEIDEHRLGGHLVADVMHFQCQARGDLCLCLEDISQGWQVKPGANYQEIPFSHVWCCSTSGGSSTLHCSFSLELTQDLKHAFNNNLSARIVAYQKGNENNHRQILNINTHVIHQRMPQSPYHSESARQLVSVCSAPSSRIEPSSNTNQQRTTKDSGASLLLPLGVKRRICAVLDNPTTQGNDWRLLARQLGVDRYIQYFGQRPSPTEHILDLWEARESDFHSLTHLLQVLRSLGREEAVTPLDAYLSQHPINV